MAGASICSVEDCNKPIFIQSRRLCAAHYYRWRRHGDPKAGKARSPNGAPERFLQDVVLAYDGDDCLIWPFTRTGQKKMRGRRGRGYAQIRRAGKMVSVQRIVCEYVNGNGDGMDSAHSCGNGHLGCVSPKHLRWATRAENIQESVRHGTHYSGR